MPIPNVSWSTRSPGSSDGISRAGLALAAASARAAAAEKLRRPAAVGAERPPYDAREPLPARSGRLHDVWAASVRRQSTRSTGSSSRNRDPGLCAGAPHEERISAREM